MTLEGDQMVLALVLEQNVWNRQTSFRKRAREERTADGEVREVGACLSPPRGACLFDPFYMIHDEELARPSLGVNFFRLFATFDGPKVFNLP